MKTMMKKSMNRKQWITRVASVLLIGWMFAVITVSVSAADGVSTEAGPEGPAQTAYAPANGPGPVIMVLSGQTGPTSYHPYAAELAKLGYYSVLLTGADILNPANTGSTNLKKAIERALKSPNAVKGKVAVIGFSHGGGGALYEATAIPDLVSMVVAYYPSTRTWANNIDSLVKRLNVPVLMMPGGLDRYKSCCLVETARAIETAAKASGAKFELVVYPDANHGFNLQTGASGEPMGAYRPDDDRDAWRRTVEMLKQYQPLK
jgi:dipeptidyl aminopeptidase/acylaminoacyl peptidase